MRSPDIAIPNGTDGTWWRLGGEWEYHAGEVRQQVAESPKTCFDERPVNAEQLYALLTEAA